MIRQLTSCARQDLRTAAGVVTRHVRAETTSAQQIKNMAPMSLPVPPLDQTLSKFLKSVRPLLCQSQYEATQAQVSLFRQQDGPKLQALLETRAKTRANWLEEWWLNTAYLEYRDPVVLFSSPGLAWPQTSFANEKERLQYAANLISAALAFNSMLDRRAIPQEMSGKSPLDMAQYYKVFGTTRIPLCGRDALQFQDPVSLPDNIVLMVNNNAYSLTVLDRERNPLPTAAILGMLEQVVREAQQPGVPVGVLTSDHRDRWARAYTLLARNGQNISSLAEIDKALFVVCLDKPLPNQHPRNKQCQTSRLLLHGAGFSQGNAANRWYDKTIQFVLGAGDDGVGITYEHSPAEGNPIGVMADFVLDRLKSQSSVQPSKQFPAPRKLTFQVSPEIEDAITTAGINIDKLAADLDIFGFKFDNFGKNQLKALKTSPDSFVQIAIQYAFFKTHGHPAAQYESGTLRKYVGGRTDVIRTCSDEAFAFCRARGKPGDRTALLNAALASHKTYANDAISARGVDRHLLGLKLIARENGLPIPPLYADAGYLASTNFQLSTSNVPTRNDAFMVYAPLVDDGYACCYNPRDLDINFGTSAWKHSSVTDINKFQAALKEALLDMRDVLSAGQPQQAKL